MAATFLTSSKSPASTLSKMPVDLSILFIKGVFKTWDLILRAFHPLHLFSKFVLHLPTSLFAREDKTRIVIVGASFAGLEAAQHLAAHGEHIEVTLIDEKEYFEFTPGIFRCFINPHHISDLTCAVDASLGRMVRGRVKDVEDGQARTAQGPSSLPAQDQHARLVSSSSVIIVGGGMAGAELAAEIISAFPSKSVTVIHAHESMCKELPAAAKAYVEQWLRKRGVKLMLHRRVMEFDEHRCVLEGGEVLEADSVYLLCSGMSPRSDAVARNAQPGQVKVQGRINVFAAGDVMMQDDCDEVKSGYLAERNAKIAACNILHHMHGEQLLSYPEDVFGDVSMIPEVYCLSLSKYDGVLAFNNLVVTGRIPAVFKWLIEANSAAAAAPPPPPPPELTLFHVFNWFLMRGMLACKAYCHINGIMSVFASNHLIKPNEALKIHSK
ncbi:hypothetical protein GUITHDRAFT_106758 [Guillardia theta CCMP2712]|uniref:FAD/NAD(P)-binding domain-containing protein n=1 Tax=Guillardia theta (strain CCMP2712) TaxID=905079 RepID=L1JFL8_GUITC|nr:hypothetical protein GUITHDRAFT_106758 [Guillardia theta CCMP2712]EKX47308.1 hypothetical protein GUITHDRAFT_106758 [Guillardia theta CCMP2712]|eukprot:XP_005834288.1 hypothetical protein GUITHDRAFT_106758 [Guillardia theta CCMP2712]